MTDPRTWLKTEIETHAFLKEDAHRILAPDGALQRWIFDFRRLIFRPETLGLIATLFLDEIKDLGHIQLGGLETAAIPLITACTLKSAERGAPLHGFYIRKSRNKTGLLNRIEGGLTDDPVVLIDDLMNRGSSFLQQVKVLEEEGKHVVAVCTILRYRDLAAYDALTTRGIRVISLFTLTDFTESLGLAPLVEPQTSPIPQPFEALWRFKPPHPELCYVIPHSAPILDEVHLYFGGDDGTFWCLRQKDGSVQWQFKILFGVLGKFTFSTPVLYDDLVIFGAYDGNLYALNKETGQRVWTYLDADWIGSSPTIAKNLGLVFIGLEFALPGKQGGIAALDSNTGDVIWTDHTMPHYTHASPAYSKQHGLVLCGSNDGVMRAYHAQTGVPQWEYRTGGDIKYSVALNLDESLAAFSSFDGAAYIVETRTGKLRHRLPTEAEIYTTPLFDTDRLYVASLDKRLYCFDVASGEALWTFNTGARIFATPYIERNMLYIGANNGLLYRLDKMSGVVTGVFQVTERIVNKVARSNTSGHLFLPTFANEIYCLQETDKMSQ